jgi:hypothetical protein
MRGSHDRDVDIIGLNVRRKASAIQPFERHRKSYSKQ